MLNVDHMPHTTHRTTHTGLYYRVGLGAGLSTMDMISDLYIITVFLKEGKTSYAYANIMMILTNWLFQLLIVWFQTGRNIFGSVFLKEALIATLGLKPGWDAWNVCTGKEQQPGQTFDAMTEVSVGNIIFKIAKKLNLIFPDRHTFHSPPQMIFSKGAEIFAESIPAGIVQTYAFIQSPNRSATAAISILISALTTGFGSALISYGEL